MGTRFSRPAVSIGVVILVCWIAAVTGASLKGPELAGASTSIQGPGGRVWPAGKWVTLSSISPDSLLQPGLIAATQSQILIFDYGDLRLKAYTTGGVFKWATGRKGHGPKEFAGAADLQTAPDERIWIADVGNSRAAIYRSDGQFERVVTFRSPVSRIAPLSSGQGALILPSARAFFERIDDHGVSTGLAPLPEVLKGHHQLSTEFVTAVGAGQRVAVAFRWSGRVLVLGADGVVRASTPGIEPHDFPDTRDYDVKVPGGKTVRVFRVDPKAPWAAYGLVVVGNEVAVLYRGTTENRGRILDFYGLDDARYHGSKLLPASPEGIASVGSNLAVLYEDPEPHVDLLKWSGAP